GMALSAAGVAGGFGTDVLGRGFGWRQPIGLLANAAIVVGLVPAVLTIGDGRWGVERYPLVALHGNQFPLDPDAGDYRVLYVGDPRALPVPAHRYEAGIGYAVVDAGPLDHTDRYPVVTGGGDAALHE